MRGAGPAGRSSNTITPGADTGGRVDAGEFAPAADARGIDADELAPTPRADPADELAPVAGIGTADESTPAAGIGTADESTPVAGIGSVGESKAAADTDVVDNLAPTAGDIDNRTPRVASISSAK